MTDKIQSLEELNAYARPRQVREGCQHILGCRCEPPYWLRLPTATELARWHLPPAPETASGRTE